MADPLDHNVEQMLQVIERHFRASSAETGKRKMCPEVRAAMAATPRHLFVPAQQCALAYHDSALPIGCCQTISQPFIVALMTELLEPGYSDKVLEIGTGSGFQAAVLARLVDHVYTLEFVTGLAERSGECLRALGVDNVTIVAGNGASELPRYAPFDKVLITAATPEFATAIIAQLRPDGRVVAPLGYPGCGQKLAVVDSTETRELQRRDLLEVAFVAFIRRQIAILVLLPHPRRLSMPVVLNCSKRSGCTSVSQSGFS